MRGKIFIGPEGGRYVKRVGPSGAYKIYVPECKGSHVYDSYGKSRKIHIGPNGGQYCIVNGEKRYLVNRPLKS